MSDLRVVAVIPVKPGSVQAMRETLNGLAEASRGHQGCTGYEVFESASAPGTFLTVETWRGRADHDAHLRTGDVVTALGAADGHLAGDIAIHPLQPFAG